MNVRDVLYFKCPPRNGEASSKKADDLLLSYQTTRDRLVQHHGRVERFEPIEPEKYPDFNKRVDLGIIQSNNAPLQVVANLVIYTSEKAISERVEKAVREKGFGLVFQRCCIPVRECSVNGSEEGENGRVWSPLEFNKYLISAQDGSATSKVENIVETAKALLELAESIPAMLQENIWVRSITEHRHESVVSKCDSLPSTLESGQSAPIEKSPADEAVSAIQDLLKTLYGQDTKGHNLLPNDAAYAAIVSFASQIQQGAKPAEDFWKSVLERLKKE